MVQAVARAQNVLHVAVATGRPFPLAQPVIAALELEGLGVVNGGAEIIDMKSGAVVYSKQIDTATLRDLVKVCQPFGYDLYTSDNQYGTPVAGPSAITAAAEKLFIGAVPSADAIKILEELEAVKDIAAHPAKSWTKGDVVDLHITHEQATKRYGVERLIDMLKVERHEVMAIGDDHNDMPLMLAAGFKVAMGDAPPQVKAIADYVTEPLEKDGAAAAIEELILK